MMTKSSNQAGIFLISKNREINYDKYNLQGTLSFKYKNHGSP